MRVAFLGLGAMGARMARHLVGAAELVVYNRTAERADALLAAGAVRAETPRAAAEGADVVFGMVTDDHAAEALWLGEGLGAVRGLRRGALAIECSTVTPGFVGRLGAAVEARGARLLDAPVAGSTPQAEAGALAFLVGGDAADLDAARPLLDRMGAAVLHAGPRGHGATLKLVVNALFAGQVALMAELLRAAERHGLAPATVADLLAKMPVTSPAAAGAAALMVAGDHAPRFPVDLVVKDLGYAAALAPTPVTEAARAVFAAARAAGDGDRNLTVVHRAAAPV